MSSSNNSQIFKRYSAPAEPSSEDRQWVRDLASQPGWSLVWQQVHYRLVEPLQEALLKQDNPVELSRAQGALGFYNQMVELLNDLGGIEK